MSKKAMRKLKEWHISVFKAISCLSCQVIGFRTKLRGWHPPSAGADPGYDFAKFCEKLHEIENILDRRGCAPRAPPLNPPLVWDPILQIGAQTSGIISGERPKRDHEESLQRNNTYQSIRPKSLRMQQPVDHQAEPCTEEFREPAPPRKRHTLPSIRALDRPYRGQSVRWTYAEVYQHLFGRYKAFHRIRDGSRQVQSDPLLALLSTSSASSSSSTAAAAPPSPPPLCRRAPLPGNVHYVSKESVYDSIGTLESGYVNVTPYSDEAPTVLYAYDDRIQIGSVPVKIYDTNDSDDDGSSTKNGKVMSHRTAWYPLKNIWIK